MNLNTIKKVIYSAVPKMYSVSSTLFLSHKKMNVYKNVLPGP